MPGPSGYISAYAHPDPTDPNDRVRQHTQSRAPGFPYDTPVSYGRETVAGDDQLAYQLEPGSHPPPGEEHDPDRPLSVWDRMSDALDVLLAPHEIGPQGPDADALGYGRDGRLGDGLVIDIDPEDLGVDLLAAFCGSGGVVDPPQIDGSGLLSLLLGPDASYDEPWDDIVRSGDPPEPGDEDDYEDEDLNH